MHGLIKRRSIAALLLAWVLPVAAANDAPPRNLLLITLDTTRADRLGCYGADDAVTPTIDRLARAGVRFDRAVSPVPLTVPAHATLLTGLVPRRHGVRDNTLFRLQPSIPLLTELLAARGYHTMAAVSAVVLDRSTGLGRGFDRYDDGVRVGPRSAFNYEERAATQTNDVVLAWLDSLESPFFLWVHYFDPHLPYVPPPPYDQRFAGRPYDGEIAFVDHAIGELLDRMAERLPRTLIVVAGDHGESLGEHGETAHGVFIYRSTQRVPLIVAGPDVPAGRTVTKRVGLVDVMPTVLDLLGAPIPPGLDGVSLRPLVAGRDAGHLDDRPYEMESLFPRLAYGWSPLRGLVEGDRVAIDAPRPELYDLSIDPLQRRNLWGESDRGGAAMLARLRELTEDDRLGPVDTDPEMNERIMRLRSLGYLSGTPSEPAPDGIDPKDGIRLLDALNEAREATQLGHAEDAIAPLLALLEENPTNVPAWLTLVSARLATGDPVAAVTAARRALRLRPQDDLVRFNLANALASEAATRPEAAAEAREQYEKTLALNPRRADAYLNYGGLLVRLGELEAARRLLDRAEAADLHSADLRFERAVLELRLGEIDAAVARFESVLELDPSDADAVEALARIALRRGQREEAIRRLERLLELKGPNDPTRADIEARLAKLRAVPPG